MFIFVYKQAHTHTHTRLCIPFAEEHAPNLAIFVDYHHECEKMMKKPPPGDVKGFQCPRNTQGETVMIVKHPAYEGDALSLCEVEVYAFAEGK